MNFMVRLSVYTASAFIGASIPLVTAPGATIADPSHSLAFHSSSRALAAEAPLASDQADAARAAIWALTNADMPAN